MYNFVCDFLLSLLTNNRWLESTVTKKELIVINRNLNTIPSVVLCCCFRKNAFQVIAVDGVCSGVLQFPTPEDCLDWLHAIASNISSLTKHNVSSERRSNSLCDPCKPRTSRVWCQLLSFQHMFTPNSSKSVIFVPFKMVLFRSPGFPCFANYSVC